ncbi:MAG: NUDIX hydrolase [Euryarchaeota archaeon]|nr:NUDIX hydrolase [Euryarchaeota archaeon]
MARPRKRHETLIYAEIDGRVYLERRRGLLRFPAAQKSLPFDFVVLHETDYGDVSVRRVKPSNLRHPDGWEYKDGLMWRDDVDANVRRALSSSLSRTVAHAVVLHRGKVLLVRSSMGGTEGLWGLPGGYMETGEDPETCVLRELYEETRIRATVTRLIGAYVSKFAAPYHFLSVVYQLTPKSTGIKLDETELSDGGWFSPEKAAGMVNAPYAKRALERVIGESRKRTRA